jgi:hypothetical protein
MHVHLLSQIPLRMNVHRTMVAFEKARRWIRTGGGGEAVAIEGIRRPF